MTMIMTIEDAFFLPGKGVVISGVNPQLDGASAERIKAIIGDRVRVARAGGSAVFKVKEIGVSESLVGCKNISLLVDSADLALLERGAQVLTTNTQNWQESLGRLFAASVNQQTLEQAAELMVSVSAGDATYHEECVYSLEQGIQAARRGDTEVVEIINKSGYRVRSAAEADELLSDFLDIYLAEFRTP